MSYITQDSIREAVGIFEDPDLLDATIAELEHKAFPRHDISVLGGQKKIEEQFGTREVPVNYLENDQWAPRTVSIRPEEKTIGAGVIIGACAYIAGTLTAISSGATSAVGIAFFIALGSLAGAAFGVLIDILIWHKFKTESEEQIKKGGLILWVRTPDPEREELAQDIMQKHGAKEVHIHSFP